jgi:hypothetical protein
MSVGVVGIGPSGPRRTGGRESCARPSLSFSCPMNRARGYLLPRAVWWRVRRWRRSLAIRRIRSRVNGTGGTVRITAGGAVCMQGLARANLRLFLSRLLRLVRSVITACTQHRMPGLQYLILNCSGQNPAGSAGIVCAGETGIHDVDVTGFDIGIRPYPGATGGLIEVSRLENNNTGIYMNGARSWEIRGTTLKKIRPTMVYFWRVSMR